MVKDFEGPPNCGTLLYFIYLFWFYFSFMFTYYESFMYLASFNGWKVWILKDPIKGPPIWAVRDILTRPTWRETTHPGNPDARDILTLGTSWRQKLQTFALCFFSFSSFRFSALRRSYAFDD